jgi:hypothetical protein
MRLKKDLAQRFRVDRECYTEAKTDFIRSVLDSSTIANSFRETGQGD